MSKRPEDDDEIMIQGDEYEEEGFEDNSEESEPSGNVDGIDKNKKLLIIGLGVGAFVLGVALVIILSVTSGKSNDTPDTSTIVNKYEDDTSTVVTEDSSNVDEILRQAGISTNEDGTVTSSSNSLGGYTEADKSSLRAAGYTGTEIDVAETNSEDVQDLLMKAKVEKDKYLQKTYKELDEDARKTESSDAYKELKQYTWLGNTPGELVYDATKSYTTETVTYNARFDKIPLRGNECLVKLYLDDIGLEPAFYNVHPERYAQMKDTGNMVVVFDMVTYNGNKYITDITEKAIN